MPSHTSDEPRDSGTETREKTGIRDAVQGQPFTGGSQMDGFVALVRDLLEESGIDRQ